MSWEVEEKLKPFILISMTCHGHIPPDMVMAALRLQRPGWHVITRFEKDFPLDISRSIAATEALRVGAEWLLFWDSDVIPPPDGVIKLVSHELPIVAGAYWRRHPEIFAEAFIMQNGVMTPIPPDLFLHYDEPKIQVDAVGMGFTLIHRRVLEALKEDSPLRAINLVGPPDFKHDFHEFFKWGIGTGEGEQNSEDINFCLKAKRAGFNVYVDRSVRCGHLATMMVKDGRVQWNPLEGGA